MVQVDSVLVAEPQQNLLLNVPVCTLLGNTMRGEGEADLHALPSPETDDFDRSVLWVRYGDSCCSDSLYTAGLGLSAGAGDSSRAVLAEAWAFSIPSTAFLKTLCTDQRQRTDKGTTMKSTTGTNHSPTIISALNMTQSSSFYYF